LRSANCVQGFAPRRPSRAAVAGPSGCACDLAATNTHRPCEINRPAPAAARCSWPQNDKSPGAPQRPGPQCRFSRPQKRRDFFRRVSPPQSKTRRDEPALYGPCTTLGRPLASPGFADCQVAGGPGSPVLLGLRGLYYACNHFHLLTKPV
jgi:hypothetical protein